MHMRAWWWVVVVGCAISCSADDPQGVNGGSGKQGGSGVGAGSGTGGGSSGNSGSGLGGGSSGNSGSSAGGSGALDEICADADVHTRSTTPVVMFVVDGSGSMCAPFGAGTTRWQALRTALLEPTQGLLFRLQRTVFFGLLLYDGTIDTVLALGSVGGSPSPGCAAAYVQTKATGECPQLIAVPPAQNSAPAIDAVFPAVELGGSTPTDKAMNVAVDQLLAQRTTNPDIVNLPQYIILATDGQPNDICVGGTGGDGSAQKQGVLAAVDRAATHMITTFVISLAGGDAGLQAHLDEVAKHGQPGNAAAVTFNPSSPQELVNTLATLLGGAIGCDVPLQGSVTVGQECAGTVTVSGVDLPCCSGGSCAGVPTDPPSGWVLKDPKTISLVGNACTDFLTSPELLLHATFPCGVFKPD